MTLSLGSLLQFCLLDVGLRVHHQAIPVSVFNQYFFFLMDCYKPGHLFQDSRSTFYLSPVLYHVPALIQNVLEETYHLILTKESENHYHTQ